MYIFCSVQKVFSSTGKIIHDELILLTLFIFSGVFFYNRAKYTENLAQKTLPVSMPKAQPPPLWKNHLTFESKVHVTTPVNHFLADSDLKRNQ